ncbi:acetylxylan esterase [Imhoffiella purpurea]|uniref:Putative deacetylase n=1 Tax=Imhoffiella purpurea TaxID=1249627 RepID=W9VGM0_9GAMM|nr:acetylxylan esterase [Imhoffiella purpurea]EXJ16156.1 putative deacetylase [Imhoffiella purpurea]
MTFEHTYPFDPSYGYSLERLLSVEPPEEPADFEPFWRDRLDRALAIDPEPHIRDSTLKHPRFHVHDLEYASTDGFPIRGWLLTPRIGTPRRGLMLGHGYGGIDGPPLDLPLEDAVYLVPCFRGIGLSRRTPISENPIWHVLHDIHRRDRYILGGCVDDIWTGVSALLRLQPNLAGHLGYLGISFGGGLGAMALAWDPRLARGHLNVPSFGHQPLRLTLPTIGSGAAVQRFAEEHGGMPDSLRYFDAALAARHIRQPMHIAAALFDPAVAPPGQFAVYNAIPGEKHLFVLEAGHFDHPGRELQERALLEELGDFLAPL